ncbi:MAG: XRE family transcriptional regulator [Reyranella sp.]|nr:MAG: XRE family transcriptional regulator [Reyranella sp.]
MAQSAFYKAFGEAIAKRRNALGYTQAELASRIGMSRASLANIERGRQNVLLHHAYSLAAALDFSAVSDLVPSIPDRSLTKPVNFALSDKSVTERGKAQISELIAVALSKHNARKVEP